MWLFLLGQLDFLYLHKGYAACMADINIVRDILYVYLGERGAKKMYHSMCADTKW